MHHLLDILVSENHIFPEFIFMIRTQDELLWGASWIHRASENASYLAYIQSNGVTLGADDDDYSFSWDDKRAGTKVLLSKVTSLVYSYS